VGDSQSKAPRIKTVLNDIRNEVGSFDLSFLSEMPMPEAKKWLMKFNGIGPKTTAIILCFSFQMPAMPVDTHIFRVSKRLRLIAKKITAEKAHDLLEQIVPAAEVFQFHMFLIRHGRDTCKARKPNCGSCALSDICPSFGKV
jgi:endonuclease-3